VHLKDIFHPLLIVMDLLQFIRKKRSCEANGLSFQVKDSSFNVKDSSSRAKDSSYDVRNTLHLGSRIPLADLESVKSGRHTLVDPYFGSLEKCALGELRDRYPNFEFVSKKAHEFLQDAIKRGVKYSIIRLDSPYAGIIGESAAFPELCCEVRSVLADGGKIEILTEFEPGKTGVCYKYGDCDDMEALYGFLNGRELDELSEQEKKELAGKVRAEKTVNIIAELKTAGFKVSFSETQDMNIISRSETALKKKKHGKPIFLITAEFGKPNDIFIPTKQILAMKLSLFKKKEPKPDETREKIAKRLGKIKEGEKSEVVTSDTTSLVKGLADGDG